MSATETQLPAAWRIPLAEVSCLAAWAKPSPHGNQPHLSHPRNHTEKPREEGTIL
jgi:hypothetical protein